MISEFLDLKFSPDLCNCLGFFFSQPQTYIRLILRAITQDTETKKLIFSVISYCVCTSQGFVTKCFLIFIVDEVKNFAVNNIYSSCWSQSRTGSVQRVSHKLEVCASKERRLLQDQVQLGIGVKVQLQVGISGQAKVVGKNLYTCNHLIFYQWILGSGDLKMTQWSFFLARFPICQKITMFNLFSIALSIFGDLLVPSRFACN